MCIKIKLYLFKNKARRSHVLCMKIVQMFIRVSYK